MKNLAFVFLLPLLCFSTKALSQTELSSPFTVEVNFKITPEPVLKSGPSGKVSFKPTTGYELAVKKEWLETDWLNMRVESGVSIFHSRFLEEEYRYADGTTFDIQTHSGVFQTLAFDSRVKSRIPLSKKLFLDPFAEYSINYPLGLFFNESYKPEYHYTSTDEYGSLILLERGEIRFHDRPTHIFRLGGQLSFHLGSVETGISVARSLSVNPSARMEVTTYYEDQEYFEDDYFLESWLTGLFIRW